MSVFKNLIYKDKAGKETTLEVGADSKNIDTSFTQASARENIKSGDKLSTILSKLAKWFADLKSVAWSGSYNDLTAVPTSFPPSSHSHAITDVTNLQSTLNGKQATITGGASSITSSNLTTSRALVSDSSGKVSASAVTATELSYLDGVTSNVQTQLNNLDTSVKSLKMFALAITFAASLKGKSFTVSGSGMSTYSGTVPDSLSAVISVPNANTTYTVKCNGKSKTITTGSYYGIYYGHVDTISSVLSENSWAQIAAVSAAGNAENYWKVGDEIDIVVNGETLTLQIYGFNHDNLTGGGKAGITFGMKNLMAETRQMNSSSTNSDGFTGSAMYSWLQNTLFPALPEDLRGYIKAVDKKTSAGSQSSTINTNSMKLFLFSAIENGLRTTTAVYKDEGETYPIFTDNASRIKKLANGSGSAHNWWERSPYATNSASFCNVSSGGGANYNGASYSYGVCFGFCV